ncbi:hypothetical protein [Pisciglobus halotolerans]|uniref:Uncharacterized protein n=1 Tax=Pisciglobus halotolerans TaxID=745365 RepID=A0A1I3C3J9_9LACT|nr:hypothetical protein [Pisciglobus halotolerans]SFH68769.1 hypothetical protein SAMN04489868_11251 [Pisciglobus halotolerans]
MSLIDEVISVDKESYNLWFERWYKKMDIESQIIEMAKQGISTANIFIKKTDEKESTWDDKKVYLVRRLRDKRTTKKIKERLGDGFDVVWEEKEYKTKLLNMEFVNKGERIRISWNNS